MADRDTTKRMFTHMINMMDQHDTMTISCGDPLMELLKDVRELLNEQEDMGKELTDAMELVHKKNERIEKLLKAQKAQKFFVDESGKITPLPVVVRCRDCKYAAPDMACSHESEWGNEISRNRSNPNWYCADGERRSE